MPADCRGLAVTASSADEAELLDATVHAYLSNDPGTGELLGKLMLRAPEMPMAHCLRGFLLNLADRASDLGRARESLAAADRLIARANERERRHIEALRAWCDGELTRATALFEEILIDHPRDVLAFRLAHYLHFFVGAIVEMRDSAARVLSSWEESVPDYGYVLGCRAFGLEETGDYAAAEAFGRRAVELNADDVWAGHAVCHVLEMQGRHREGIDWVNHHENAWAERNAFANHVWWHRSLYYLELEEHDAVLDQYDRYVWRGPSDDNLDITNAAALLLRLDMLGVDVGDRWHQIAGVVAETRLDERTRPFNDAHFIMPLAMTGRRTESDALLASMRGHAEAHLNEAMTIVPTLRDIGVPLAEAVRAYADGDYARAVDTIMPIRYRLLPLGGSWAQRDVFARLLIESARRSGRTRLARALLAERAALKPTSGPTWKMYASVLDQLGDAAGATAARERAGQLLAA